MKDNQGEFWSARDLKSKGLDQVSNHNTKWIEQSLTAFRYFPASEFTGEDVRKFLETKELIPLHHNAWGALISVMIKRGLIARTGKRRQMIDPQSHARLTDIYTKTYEIPIR